MIDPTIAYNALKSRDPRFDGLFFVGVTSTHIYCRPICPARTPKQENCLFFSSPERAEKVGFRPCLRCRPELAPGAAPVDDMQRIAQSMMQRMEHIMIEDGQGLEEVAAQFQLSSRQLRRIIQQELGVSPLELLQTRRLLLAKQLLTETQLPITEIAFASGFASVRRFNDAFHTHYRMPPTQLRKTVTQYAPMLATHDTFTVQLAYRPPYDWQSILRFLQGRMIQKVESVTESFYARTVRIGEYTGWIKVTHAPEKHALMLECASSLVPVLPIVLQRVRHLFDLNARPDSIAEHLQQDPHLQARIRAYPGLRVPGAFDGFEMAIRAILGQQITVKAATTLACRFVEAFGEAYHTPYTTLTSLTPSPERIAQATVDDIAKLGIIRTRAESIIALAKAYVAEELLLEAGAHPDETMAKLIALPGIGPWTAHYIAMRALQWPDAFPKEDIAIRKHLGGVTAKQAESISQAWRPWRSYAVLYLWQ